MSSEQILPLTIYRLQLTEFEMEGLLLLLLEAGVALALLVFIVWWTWPRRTRDGEADKRDRP